MLDVLLHLFALGKPHGKIHAVRADKVRHQLRRVGIERRSENLQTLWPKIFLDAAQNLSGMLAVRSSGVQERQHDHFPGILAKQHLAAAIHADGELTCRTRHLLGESVNAST
jgi:folylpolyglutamate synthase/dihydropteroate synthase